MLTAYGATPPQDRFVASPLRAIHLRGTTLEAADLVAATLRHVQVEAVRTAGG